jgi:ribosomal protein L32
MLASIRNAAICALRRQLDRFFPPLAPQLSLAGFPCDAIGPLNPYPISADESNSTLEDSLWFAVPKKKVSRGKKRMKTTLQKRIKLKDNIVIDKRTGELTLKHKLPYNWKNYLPGNAEYAPGASIERP